MFYQLKKTIPFLILLTLILTNPKKSNAQADQSPCPAGTTSLQSLQTTNILTGQYLQNWCTYPNGSYLLQNGTSSGSGNNLGPVINVTNPNYSGCPAATNADWTACLTSAAAAVNALAYQTIGTPTAGTAYTNALSSCYPCSSGVTITGVTAAAGTTGIVIITTQSLPTITITDTAGNTYAPINPAWVTTTGSNASRVFGTAAGAMKALAGGTITITTGGVSTYIGAAFVAYSNVGSYGAAYVQTGNGTGTTLTGSSSKIIDNNNVLLCGFGSNVVSNTFSISTGTLVIARNTNASDSLGLLLGQVTSAVANTSVNVAGSQTVSNNWDASCVEMRSVVQNPVTLYFPAGIYNYTGTALTFPYPVTIYADATTNTNLCYMGTGNAITLGQAGLTGDTWPYMVRDYWIEGLQFSCGQNMTQGIYIYPYVYKTRISKNSFWSFGPGGSTTIAQIYSAGQDDDLLVEDNTIFNLDQYNHMNVFSNNTNTQLRYLANHFVCGSLVSSCGASGNSVPLITVAGYASNISSNNFNFGCPDIYIAGALDVRIENNYIETTTSAGFTCPAIQFSSNDGLRVVNNYINTELTQYAIQPLNGTQTLTNALVAFNYIVDNIATTPIVALNNLTGQTGNLAMQNMCSTSLGAGAAPCQLTHTTGANINQWNNDYWPVLTFAASTSASYPFLSTYGVAPHCTITPISPGATTFTITTLNTTTLTVTASASFTGTVDASCGPDAQ